MAVPSTPAVAGLRDIVRRQDRAHAEVTRNSGHLTNELLEIAADCVFAVDADWRFTYLNRRALDEISGGRDILQTGWWDEFPALLGTVLEHR